MQQDTYNNILLIIIILLLCYILGIFDLFFKKSDNFTNEEEVTIQKLIDEGILSAEPSDSQKLVALRLYN